MNTTIRTALIILAVVVFGAALFFAGAYFGGARYAYTPYGIMGGYGPGGMMGNPGSNYPDNGPYGNGAGMMGGMMNGDMMGGPGPGGLGSAQPISVDDARIAVESYLAALGNDDLAIKEIMIFDNGAYAIIQEESSGIGAFELLLDPVGLSVFPEHGPNMMWNLKYGMNSGYSRGGSGMMGGMMRGWYGNNVQVPDIQAEMPVTPDQASQTAQKYLDTTLPGVEVSDEVISFYGYYTIDLERDSKIVGMLSVNGYTGQVFLHTWHGDFIEESDE